MSNRAVLYMAISADGFIAGPNNETPWSDEEWQAYRQFVKSCDVCLIGSNTYQVMKRSNEFVDGCKYIVATRDAGVDTGSFEKINIQIPQDLPKVKKLGVVGGGELNGLLMRMGVIDEVILDVEPVILGDGIKLFGSHEVKVDLKLMNSKMLNESTIQNHYEVIR